MTHEGCLASLCYVSDREFVCAFQCAFCVQNTWYMYVIWLCSRADVCTSKHSLAQVTHPVLLQISGRNELDEDVFRSQVHVLVCLRHCVWGGKLEISIPRAWIRGVVWGRSPSRGHSSSAGWPESLAGPRCSEWVTGLGLPHQLEKMGPLMLLPWVLARGSAVSWGCVNERNFKEFGSVCFSAQRMQALGALPGGNTNNPHIPLQDNLFWTNLPYRFCVLEAVVPWGF